MKNQGVFVTSEMFGLAICVARFRQAADQLMQHAIRRAGPPAIVVTPNVDHVVRLDADPQFRQLYVQADYIFADGMPLVWASRKTARPLPERVTGADLFVDLARACAQQQVPVFVIGGMPGQEQMLSAAFARVYPGLQVELFCPSMQFDPLGPEGQEALRRVNACRPGIVFVCLGMPKQERWAMGQRAQMQAGLVLCVGAAMEFALGFKSRAPLWMQRVGLEWCWRLASEPRRLWRRYIVQGSRFAGLLRHEWKLQRTIKNSQHKGSGR
jgi:N-acetylglucosaminyldiphosphoundecaprenol N-acetyl-beta-D-mannosaminyltransferase